jgi:hypothetical protein
MNLEIRGKIYDLNVKRKRRKVKRETLKVNGEVRDRVVGHWDVEIEKDIELLGKGSLQNYGLRVGKVVREMEGKFTMDF